VQSAELICFSTRGVLGAAKRLLTELKRVFRSGNRTVEGIAIVADRKKGRCPTSTYVVRILRFHPAACAT
jgi:hypothetical protein